MSSQNIHLSFSGLTEADIELPPPIVFSSNEDRSAPFSEDSLQKLEASKVPVTTLKEESIIQTNVVVNDDFSENDLPPIPSMLNLGSSSRIDDPSEEGYLEEDDIMELVEYARSIGSIGKSHADLVGLDPGTQCAILWKSLMMYLLNNPMEYTQLGAWPSKIVKAIPNALKNDPYAMGKINVITVQSFYLWKTYASNITSNIKHFGCSYNSAGRDLFLKSGNYMIGETVIVDTTYYPYYVPYELTVKGGGRVLYNAMPKFTSSDGKLFTRELVLLYLYSYALMFKCKNKIYSLEPLTFNGYIGNSPNPSFISPSPEVLAAFKSWTPPASATIVGAYHHFITWSLTAVKDKESRMGPLFPKSERGKWIASELYEVAGMFRISPKVVSTAYILPADLLDTMRRIRDDTILDQGWCKDSDQGGFVKISEGPDAGKYCLARTVIAKCLHPLSQILQMKPNYVLYGGVAGSGNYQVSYMSAVLEKHDIKVLTFDKVPRVNTGQVDATNVDDVAALFTLIPENSRVVAYCDIDFAGQNDNTKPVKIINTFYEACPKNIALIAVYHKATLLAPIPVTTNPEIGVVFVRKENGDYVIGRKHNAEGVLVGMKGKPHTPAASAVDSRLYDHLKLGPLALRWLNKFAQANIFRGLEVPIGTMTTDGTKLVQFSALKPKQLIEAEDELVLCPVADVRVKTKVDSLTIPEELTLVKPRLEREGSTVRAILPPAMSDAAITEFINAMNENYELFFQVTAIDRELECSSSTANQLGQSFLRTVELKR
jgi:hypothetical protein